jgi:hypothetical protein
MSIAGRHLAKAVPRLLATQRDCSDLVGLMAQSFGGFASKVGTIRRSEQSAQCAISPVIARLAPVDEVDQA